MNNGTDLHDGLKKISIKLYTLRDSCRGIVRTQRYPPDFSWFEAATGICQEALDQIRDAGGLLKKSGQ